MRVWRGRDVTGFTVIEVMLFLTVSAVIFVGAQLAFQGQQGRTQFEQGTRDAASRLRQSVSQIGTSLFNGAGQYSCSISDTTGRPVLSPGASQIGGNQACLFLGDAFQVIPGSTNIYIYTVLGAREYTVGGASQPVTSLSQAMPEPAIANNANLTQTYNTTWGTVNSSSVTYQDGSTASSSLVGFYNSLQDGYNNSGAAGGQSIVGKGYAFSSTDPGSVNSAALQSCIEEQNANGVNCTSTKQISQWNVCFHATGSNQNAILTVNSNPSGITTDINFTSCS